jgi:glutamate/tyrosine decarboxylase-like PLP-dependent enzyme
LSEYGFQQTRGFRALKVWMTMMQFGVNGYRSAIAGNLALAAYLADRIRMAPDFELMAPRGLSVVCFRYIDPSADGEEAMVSMNRALLERLQLGGEAFITSTELGGRFVLRACIVNDRSTRDDVDRLLAEVRRIGAELMTRSA